MQDAPPKRRTRVLNLFIILALGMVSLPTYSSDTAPAPLLSESAALSLLSDLAGDGGQEGGFFHGSGLPGFTEYPQGILSVINGFSGLVHCASFPILPQAPPAI